MRRWPSRAANQPVSGSMIASDTAYDVMIQVPWVALTPIAPAMVGTETLAIVRSRMFMNAARASANVAASRRPPANGSKGCVAVWPRAGPRCAARLPFIARRSPQ